jgi:hypothetical protein
VITVPGRWLAASLHNSDGSVNSKEHARRRASVVRAAQRLALPLRSIS